MQCIGKAEKIITPSDFDPPLKRKEPLVPYYWTVDELANELGVTARKVQYDISSHKLFAYRSGNSRLVPERDALQYIWNYRNKS